MKTLAAALLLSFLGTSAFANVYAPYGQWTSLPHCGGSTRLICDDVANARRENKCRIEFNNSYSCQTVKLYVGSDFYPTFNTNVVNMDSSFYVDNAKVGFFSQSFRVFMTDGSGNAFEKITYQFGY